MSSEELKPCLKSALRAMASNYSQLHTHCWDHLDGETCTKAADELDALEAERDTLRQQLGERDAQITSMRAEVTLFIETHWMPVARQRDKLADLLQKARWYVASARYSDNDEGDFASRRQAVMLSDIDAALAEAEKQ